MRSKREFFHSISRLIDRAKQAKKDIKRLRDDTAKDFSNIEDDFGMILRALESFLNDLLKEERKEMRDGDTAKDR